MKKSNWQVVCVCFETKLGLWKRLMTSIGRLVSKEIRGTPPEKRFWAPDVEFSQNWYIIDPIYILCNVYIYKHTQSYIYISNKSDITEPGTLGTSGTLLVGFQAVDPFLWIYVDITCNKFGDFCGIEAYWPGDFCAIEPYWTILNHKPHWTINHIEA